MRLLQALMLVTVLSASAAQADESCILQKITTLDTSADSMGGVLVPMSVGAANLNMLVDTGGVYSMMTSASADRLGLSQTRIMDPVLRMMGGKPVDHYVVANDVLLGGLRAKQLQFLILPDVRLAKEVEGTIAPDILQSYDDDFDLGNNKLSLFSQDHCRGKVVYWTTDAHAEIPFKIDGFGHADIPVNLDGKIFYAWIDTGASQTVMSLETAQSAFGFAATDPQLKSYKDGDNADFQYPFLSLSFEGVSVQNPDIVLLPNAASRWMGQPRIILGMNVIRKLHLYFAYKEKKLYVTPASAH
jgi:predicted aspartyl protease